MTIERVGTSMIYPTSPVGAELRDEGMARAENSAKLRHPAAHRYANRWLIDRAMRDGTFTSEDLIAALEREQLVVADMRLQWIGPLFLSAVRSKLIRRVSYAVSTRPSRHCGPVAVYEKGERSGYLRVADRHETVAEVGRLVAGRLKAAHASYQHHIERHGRPNGAPVTVSGSGPEGAVPVIDTL